MSEITEINRAKIRLWACGGLGLNIGRNVENFRTDELPAMARLETAYIDTSKSNVKNGIDPKHCYFLKDMDGSGQVRKENAAEITKNILAILQQHKPGDLNIVLSSASGGSGSVIAPSLVSELLSRDANVVVIMVGDGTTGKFTENTRDTIKSYEGVSRVRKAPVVATYFQNGVSASRAEIDGAIISLIGALCVLFSRQNHGLDTQDLHNFLYFSNPSVSSFQPRLAQLSLIEGNKSVPNIGTVISVATLATETSGSSFSQMPDFQCEGLVPSGANNVITDNAPIHFVTSTGNFGNILKELQASLDERAGQRRAIVESESVLGANDTTTENGLVGL